MNAAEALLADAASAVLAGAALRVLAPGMRDLDPATIPVDMRPAAIRNLTIARDVIDATLRELVDADCDCHHCASAWLAGLGKA